VGDRRHQCRDVFRDIGAGEGVAFVAGAEGGRGVRAHGGVHIHDSIKPAYEHEHNPSRLPENHGMRVLELPILDEANAAMQQEIQARVKNWDYAGYDADAMMIRAYRQFVDEFTDIFRQFMRPLLEVEGQPVLWHCKAGKDRTGFAAVILLRTLGVEESFIYQDYLLSARYVDRRRGSLLLLRLLHGNAAVVLVLPLLGVQAAWIDATSWAIDEKWGSFERYVRDGLGLSSEDVTRLQTYTLV
jgi:protein-tyrosine phosphatase